MDTNNMKNIVILKNLPSNLVEEAIIVVKDKKEAIDVDFLKEKEVSKEKNKKKNVIQGYMKEEDFKKIERIQKDNRVYVVKEAEMIVNDYLTKIEDNKNFKAKEKMEKMYHKLKYINFVLLAVSVLSTLICIIK